MKFLLPIIAASLLITPIMAQQQTFERINDRVLVLKNGSVMHGKITKTRGGYLIEANGRQDAIPIGYVLFTAEDLSQAYRFKRAAMAEFTAKTHTELAEWCFKNRLFDDARAELKQALKIDINDKAARQLAVKIENSEKAKPVAKSVKWSKEFKRTDEETEAEVTPIGGLNRKLAFKFVKSVQPILISSCGNGSCHGGQKKKGFHLVHIPPRGSFRNRIEANLETIVANVKKDPLLMKMAMEKRGQVHSQHRVKGMSKKQVEIVTSWAKDVLEHRKKYPTTKPSEFVQLVSGSTQEVLSSEKAAIPKKEADIISRVAAEEKPDPFDPNEFNRLHRRSLAQ